LLQQDSARPHTSAAKTDAIASLRFTFTYSLQPGYHSQGFFPKLKEDFRGQNFSSDEETGGSGRK